MLDRSKIGAIKTTNIKGKEYAEVNSRVLAFYEACPGGAISTELLHDDGERCVFRATIVDGDGKPIATGHAYELQSASYINKTSYIENCETSAVGRALGFAGIGINGSICSAEELTNALKQQQVDPRLEDAKHEVWRQVKRIAALRNIDPKDYMADVKKRRDWNANDAITLEMIAGELMEVRE